MPTNEAQLKKDIGSGSLSPVYFLYGDEHYLIRHYVNRIIKKTVTDNIEFNLDEYDEKVSVQQVYDSAMAFPLMSEKKCVSVCDLPVDKLSQSDFKALLEMVSEPNPTTVLLLWFETVEIPQKNMPDRFKKLIAAVEKGGGAAVSFPHKSEMEIANMLCDGASKRRCRMQPTTAKYMISVCGDSLFLLINELEKVCAYALSSNGIITNETIDAVCSRTVEASAYGISRELFANRLPQALKLLADLFYMRTEPLIILAGIADTYIDIYRLMASQKAGLSKAQASQQFGYGNRAFRLDYAERYAKQLNREAVNLSLEAIAEADNKLKGSREDPRMIMETLLITLAYIKSKGVRP